MFFSCVFGFCCSFWSPHVSVSFLHFSVDVTTLFVSLETPVLQHIASDNDKEQDVSVGYYCVHLNVCAVPVYVYVNKQIRFFNPSPGTVLFKSATLVPRNKKMHFEYLALAIL